MSKTKDGFYKLYGSTIGSNTLILLAGGGINSLSYYTPYTVYNYTNGCLVKTDIETTSTAMVTFKIEGNSYYENVPILTIGQFYNYNTDGTIHQYKAIHYGYLFGDIEVFCYKGFIYLWFKLSRSYQSFLVYVYLGNVVNSSTTVGTNRVVEITNEAKPSSNTTRDVTIIPEIALNGLNYQNYLPLWNGNTQHLTNTNIIYSPITGGTAGLLLQAEGAAKPPVWVDRSKVSVGHLLGGKPGSLVYQSAENTTSFLNAPTTNNNYILKYNVSEKKPYWAVDGSFTIWLKYFDKVTLSTEWLDLFDFKGSGFASGTYCVLLYIRYTEYEFFNCYYSGIMSLYAATNVNDSESNSEEILLHYSGHHTKHRIYLRLKTQFTKTTPEGETITYYPILLISCSENLGTVSISNNQFFIKLKQLI